MHQRKPPGKQSCQKGGRVTVGGQGLMRTELLGRAEQSKQNKLEEGREAGRSPLSVGERMCL